MIYLFITVFLDILLSSFISSAYQNINILFPLLFASAIPIIYQIIKNKKAFFILMIIISIIYDTLFSDIFLVNSYYFILYSLLINRFYQKHYPKVLNIILTSIIGIILYDIFIFFILILNNYSSFVINELYYKIIRSILINFLYVSISLIILKSRIFGHKKIRKKF